MKYLGKVGIRYALLALCFFSCISIAEGEKELLDILKDEQDVNSIYNEINQAEWSTGNLDLVYTLWIQNTQKYPNLPWDRLNHDVVRLALANVLMQANRQCRISINISEVHDFVRSKAKSDDLMVKGKATYLLGLAGNEQDIPFLSSVIREEREGYAEEAALSLTFMHSNKALEALEKLSSQVKRPSLKIFLNDLIDKYRAYELTDYSEGCENKSRSQTP